MPVNPGDGTGAIEKAIDVLEKVGAAPDGVSQAELAAQLSLPRTTAYRLLATLVARGMLRRDPLRKVYRLGPLCFEMARRAYIMPDLAAAAMHELRGLRDLTGETCYLAALDGLEVVSLERCDGAHSERSAAALGQRKSVYCTSQGKAILSAMAPEARDALVRELSLKSLTPNTITDRRRLNAELRIISARGYAIDDEEIVPGVRCAGAAIVDAQGAVRGALSVAGPAYRLTRERLELLGPEIAQAARRVGAQLAPMRALQEDAVVRAVSKPWAFHGAFPAWDSARQRLVWADTLAPSIRVFDPCSASPAGGDLALLDMPVRGLMLHGDEIWVARGEGLVAVAPDGSCRSLGPWLRGLCHAFCAGDQDDIWAALPASEDTSSTVVGLASPDGGFSAQWQLSEAVQALRWSAQDGLLYAAAPDSGSILVFRPGTAAVRRLATMPRGAGRVCGLALDPAGGIWVALYEGWSVLRFLRDGSLDRVVGLPVPCPTDLAIGGQNLDKLYVTTARQNVPLEMLAKAPLSGCLFEMPVADLGEEALA
ncbi:IclR family transcriptional regulator domain-containing protein [Candidimonas nitroreducens]|uniref:IclR family transcriptional regulator n=1 Tax=Candidimonas nitroreducens TaxID=683354 RepID=A0A225MYI1_9BURK|nr:IclR family transcriptional regulator C-terminal domain-containing protein [Candidimonas nitroreducens]OWT66184.1 IclR family transcriptional regulator [Candidimonas nitroreducens]